MQWKKLELRKASNLRKEVDDAIRTLSQHIQKGDERQIEIYRAAFAERIDELEEFYLQHDDDERAVLFEKQRLRLRRALQATNQAAAVISRGGTVGGVDVGSGSGGGGVLKTGGRTTDNSKLPQSPTGAPSALRNPETPPVSFADQQGGLMSDGARRGVSVEDLASPTPAKSSTAGTPGLNKTAVQDTPRTGPRVGRSPGLSATTSTPKSSTKKKKKVKPLYAWETREDAADDTATVQRQPVETDYGVFVPSAQILGFYEQQHALPVSQQHVDFQIILSEADFQKLSARRRAKKLREKSDARKNPVDESPYLFSSMPYVDAQRVERSLYRRG